MEVEEVQKTALAKSMENVHDGVWMWRRILFGSGNEHFTSFACQFLMDAFLASTPAYPGREEGQKKSQAKTMGSVHDGLHVWESILTRVTE